MTDRATGTLRIEWAEVVQEYQQRGVSLDVKRIKDILWGRVSDGPITAPHGDVAHPHQDSILEMFLELKKIGDPETIRKNIEDLERIKAYHESLRGPGNEQWDDDRELSQMYNRLIESQRFLLQTAEGCRSILEREGFQYDPEHKILKKSGAGTGRPQLWLNSVIAALYHVLGRSFLEAFDSPSENNQQIRAHIEKLLSPYFSPELITDRLIKNAIDYYLKRSLA